MGNSLCTGQTDDKSKAKESYKDDIVRLTLPIRENIHQGFSIRETEAVTDSAGSSPTRLFRCK